jgi:UDP-3-O-[3-hydroxymyristoyl] glucosamine N-acyltransferase
MNIPAKQIAEVLGGEIIGDKEICVNHLSGIEEGKEGALTFLSNEKYIPFIYSTQASIVIVNKDFEPEKEVKSTMILVEDAYSSFAKLLEFVESLKGNKVGIEQPSFVDESAEIGEDPYIGAFAYIGKNVTIGKNVKIYPHAYIGDDVEIGDDSIIYSGVKIYHQCVLGKSNIIHAGAVIGSDGFGFAPQANGEYMKIPQLGNVVLGNYVEIGANTTIDRATMGSTQIGEGTKLDNLIQIAHNVDLGKNNVLAAQIGIAGSAKIGSNCMIGGQAAIAGHIEIGNEVKIAAKSGIPASIPDGEVHMGPVAFEKRSFQKSYMIFKKLPDLYRSVQKLEKQMNSDI